MLLMPIFFIFSLIPPSQATALAECQHQFSSHRWNCTFSDKLTEDVILQRGLLEGMIYYITKNREKDRDGIKNLRNSEYI